MQKQKLNFLIDFVFCFRNDKETKQIHRALRMKKTNLAGRFRTASSNGLAVLLILASSSPLPRAPSFHSPTEV